MPRQKIVDNTKANTTVMSKGAARATLSIATETPTFNLPVTLVVRKPNARRKGEAYLVQNSATKRYLVGLPSSEPRFLDIMKSLAELANRGSIKAVGEMRDWIAAHVA